MPFLKHPTPINIEIELDPKRYIVSKTDQYGVITYANQYFAKICGYDIDELLGLPHSIIRHPDMPKVIFKLMWERIQSNKNIVAIIKNLAKDGRHYWVMTDFETKIDPNTKQPIQYTAYRKAAPKDAVDKISALYAELLDEEKNGGIEASEKLLNEILRQKKMSYDEYIDEITGKSKGIIKTFFDLMKKMYRN